MRVRTLNYPSNEILSLVRYDKMSQVTVDIILIEFHIPSQSLTDSQTAKSLPVKKFAFFKPNRTRKVESLSSPCPTFTDPWIQPEPHLQVRLHGFYFLELLDVKKTHSGVGFDEYMFDSDGFFFGGAT